MRREAQNRDCGYCRGAVLHGIGDSSTGAAVFGPMFLNAGYSVLLPDSRAQGASGGEYVTYADGRTPPYNSERLARANPRDPLWLVPHAGRMGASSVEPDGSAAGCSAGSRSPN